MILTSFTSSEKVCWRDTGWCSVKCGILSSCDSLLVRWCDIGCPSLTAVSRLMRPKTDTLVLPPHPTCWNPACHLSSFNRPCVIHCHYSCSTSGELKLGKLAHFRPTTLLLGKLHFANQFPLASDLDPHLLNVLADFPAFSLSFL